MSEKKFDAVLFDFDGTVADTGRGIFRCVQWALSQIGIEEQDKSRLSYFIGPPLEHSFMHQYGVDEKTAKFLVDKYREIYRTEGMFECDLYDGIEDALQSLKADGYRLAVASSKPEPFIRAILERINLIEIFEFISAPAVSHVYPSKKELIEKALGVLGVPASRAVMVGDRCFDIDGANEANVKSIGAVYGYGGEKELSEHGATFLAFSAKDIPELIK